MALAVFVGWSGAGADAPFPLSRSLHGETLARAFAARPDLRPPITLALARLADQARAVAGEAAAMEEEGEDNDLDSDDGAPDAAATARAALADAAPQSYTPAIAATTLASLRLQSRHWLPLLLNAHVAAGDDAGERRDAARAVASLAPAADPAVAATVYRAALAKLADATAAAAAAEPPAPGSAAAGGRSPGERRVTFLSAACALAPGVDDAAATDLWDAAMEAAADGDASVQKAAYRCAAALARARPAWLDASLDAVLASLAAAAPSAAAASKRHRLAAVREAVRAASRAGRPLAPRRGAPADRASALVAEIVLCVKEPNRKTRTAAYDLIVALGAPAAGAADAAAAYAPLADLTAAVLAGVAAGSPRLASASVMALARLLHAYPGPLAGDGARLLPALLPLLRTKSREAVKAALGFCKVAASRLPADALVPHLRDLLHALLAWSDDPKNKFRLRVRLVVERLVRRLGADAVAAAMPTGDARLMAHIRKQASRRDRRRAGGGEDESEDGDGDGARTARTARTTRTGRTGKSAWAPTALFSEGGDARRTGAASARGAGARLPADRGARDPLDLLGATTARDLVGAARRGGRAGDDGAPLPVGNDGRLIVADDPAPRKRGRAAADDDGFDSADSDFDDIRRSAADGGRAAWRATAGAASLAGSAGARTARTSKTSRTDRTGRTNRTSASAGGRSASHGADRFAAKKGGAKGDVKKGAVEPYAYWPLDRKMLNRRPAKQKAAKGGLAGVVDATKAGRGAKRARR